MTHLGPAVTTGISRGTFLPRTCRVFRTDTGEALRPILTHTAVLTRVTLTLVNLLFTVLSCSHITYVLCIQSGQKVSPTLIPHINNNKNITTIPISNTYTHKIHTPPPPPPTTTTHTQNQNCNGQSRLCAERNFKNRFNDSSRYESTHKGVNQHSKDVTQTQQQRPESPTVTLTWHA